MSYIVILGVTDCIGCNNKNENEACVQIYGFWEETKRIAVKFFAKNAPKFTYEHL